MSDSEHPLLKQAFQHAENCLAEANAIVDYLDQAIEDLQDEEPELREAVTQSFIKADQFRDRCGEIVNDLLDLRLKYRTHTLRLDYLLKLKHLQKHLPVLNFDDDLAGVHRNSRTFSLFSIGAFDRGN